MSGDAFKIVYQFDIHIPEEKQRFISFFSEFYTTSLTDSEKMWRLICDAEVVKTCREDLMQGVTLTERSVHNSEENHVVSARRYKDETVFMSTLTLALSNANCIPVRTDDFFLFKDSRPCTAMLISEHAITLPNANISVIKSLKPAENWFYKAYNSFVRAYAYSPQRI